MPLSIHDDVDDVVLLISLVATKGKYLAMNRQHNQKNPV